MVAHPPMLYMGYVGFSVAFAFAIAALIGGRLDATWARWSRPWTTVAWMFLTCGIALGSFWAYYELGWGGWWFWDPVENASFMPWLVGTASDSFAGGYRKARRVQELDGVAGNHRVFTEFARNVSRSFRRVNFCTCVRDRSQARHFYSGVSRVSSSVARYCSTRGAQNKLDLAASLMSFSRESLLLSNNVLVDCRRRFSAARHTLSADRRCAWAWGNSQLAHHTSICFRSADGAGGVPDGYRSHSALEESKFARVGRTFSLGLSSQRGNSPALAVCIWSMAATG